MLFALGVALLGLCRQDDDTEVRIQPPPQMKATVVDLAELLVDSRLALNNSIGASMFEQYHWSINVAMVIFAFMVGR